MPKRSHDHSDDLETSDLEEAAEVLAAPVKSRIELLLIRSIWTVLVAVFLFGGWVSTLEYRTQESLKHYAIINEQLKALELWKVATEANRFSAQDQVRYASSTQEQLSNLDKRVTRVEDAFAGINRSLDRIETKLGIH